MIEKNSVLDVSEITCESLCAHPVLRYMYINIYNATVGEIRGIMNFVERYRSFTCWHPDVLALRITRFYATHYLACFCSSHASINLMTKRTRN